MFLIGSVDLSVCLSFCLLAALLKICKIVRIHADYPIGNQATTQNVMNGLL